jgi:myo-inositol-1(or 4)-monophosphatase
MQPLDFAKKIALKAGEFLKKNSTGRRSIQYKDDIGSNIVTDMDTASEAMIVKALKKEFPDHAIVAEESGLSGDSPHKWYIDPVDGTTNFAHGFPIWAVTLAYESNGVIQAGATYAPMLDQMYWAQRGKGAYCNGKRLHVTKTAKLETGIEIRVPLFIKEGEKVRVSTETREFGGRA